MSLSKMPKIKCFNFPLIPAHFKFTFVQLYVFSFSLFHHFAFPLFGPLIQSYITPQPASVWARYPTPHAHQLPINRFEFTTLHFPNSICPYLPSHNFRSNPQSPAASQFHFTRSYLSHTYIIHSAFISLSLLLRVPIKKFSK